MTMPHRPSTLATSLITLAAGFVAGYALGPASVTAAKPDVPGVSARVAALEAQVDGLATKLGCVQIEGQFDVVFKNCNVHIRNGTGTTESTNGLGNLIIGYNEPHPDAEQVLRTGSHNLIVGPRHEYTSFGGFVAGQENTISNWFASIPGGTDNVASGIGATVSGGAFNVVSGEFATVSGGEQHTAPLSFQHLP